MKENKYHGDYYRRNEKRQANEAASWIISIVILLIVFLFLLLVFTNCTGPGAMVREGYLVSVADKKTEVKRFETVSEVDSFILLRTGIPVDSKKMFGGILFFYELRNEDYSVYVEKKGIYQKKAGGKERWRMYDEKLAAE